MASPDPRKARNRSVNSARDLSAEPADPAFHDCPVALVRLDTAGRCTSVNPAAAALLDRDDLAGRDWMSIVHPDDARAVAGAVGRTRTSGRPCRIEALVGAPGATTWLEVHVADDGHGDGVVLTLTDIGRVKDLEDRVNELATTDAVTGLLNRSGLNDALYDALRDCAPSDSVLVAVVDIDRFDVLNGSFGHDAGDLVLAEIGRRLGSTFAGHEVVGRLGDDEFLVASAPATTGVDRFEQALESVFARPVELGGVHTCVDASIGVVHAAAQTASPDRLTGKAEDALRSAKATAGTSISRFDERSASARCFRSELELDVASTDLTDELVVDYQPIVAVRTGRPVAFEALVRWNHSVRGLLGPGEFIRAAERTGRVRCITRHVVATASRDLATWRHELDVSPVMAVNVAPHDLVDPSFLGYVIDVTGQFGVDPWQLQLEITESGLMTDLDAGADLIRRASEHGFGVSIDDFGTGYSSLSHLAQLPVTSLKIDQAFIAALDADLSPDVAQRSETMVRAITGLSHSLGLDVVAEGVETTSQFDRIRRIGCDLAQGFLHSPPLGSASSDLLDILRSDDLSVRDRP